MTVAIKYFHADEYDFFAITATTALFVSFVMFGSLNSWYVSFFKGNSQYSTYIFDYCELLFICIIIGMFAWLLMLSLNRNFDLIHFVYFQFLLMSAISVVTQAKLLISEDSFSYLVKELIHTLVRVSVCILVYFSGDPYYLLTYPAIFCLVLLCYYWRSGFIFKLPHASFKKIPLKFYGALSFWKNNLVNSVYVRLDFYLVAYFSFSMAASSLKHYNSVLMFLLPAVSIIGPVLASKTSYLLSLDSCELKKYEFLSFLTGLIIAFILTLFIPFYSENILNINYDNHIYLFAIFSICFVYSSSLRAYILSIKGKVTTITKVYSKAIFLKISLIAILVKFYNIMDAVFITMLLTEIYVMFKFFKVKL